MSWSNDNEAAAQEEALQRLMEKRRQRGEKLEAFAAPTGTRLTTQFWGGEWVRHLATYCGYDARLGRGRTCLRQGRVFNLVVEAGIVTAEVAGSDLYGVEIHVDPLPGEAWQKIKDQCAGGVGSLLDLLGGKLGDAVMKIVTDPDTGLFPGRQEIRHQCSCPDDADLCLHQAAVLYAVGVRFDHDPKVFFELRGVDPSELLASSAATLTDSPGGTGVELAGEDLNVLFGIDLLEPGAPPGIPG